MVVIALAATLVAVGILAVSGYLLFTRPHGDPLTNADAIVVLGGETDGRLAYGLDLARQGYANTVVLSDSYSADGPDGAEYRRACASGTAAITVICFRPDPFSTRGEAMFVARLAKENHWTHVIVVSWNFHTVRARYIFGQCFGGTVTMRPVPRSYDYSVLQWARTYAYQFVALGKAAVLGCDSAR